MEAKGTGKVATGNSEDHDDKCWESGWTCWVIFRDEFGPVEVDPNDKPALARWVREQRANYQHFVQGKPSKLDSHKIQRMNAKGFYWTEAGAVRETSTTDVSNHDPSTDPAPTKNPTAAGQESREIVDDAKGEADTPTNESDKDPGGIDTLKTGDTSDQAPEPPLDQDSKVASALRKCRKRSASGDTDNHSDGVASKGDGTPAASEIEKLGEVLPQSPLVVHVPHAVDEDATDIDDDDDEEDGASEGDDVLPDWAAGSDKKPRAKKTPVKLAASAELKEAPDNSSSRYPRRNRRSLSEADVSAAAAPAAKRPKLEFGSSPTVAPDGRMMYSVLKKSESTGKKEMRNYEIRNLRRHVPEEQEAQVREQCMVEYADLLVSSDLLEPDKKLGVDHQTAKANVAWEESFLDYLVFKKVYGHGIVPKVFPQNPALGRWTVRNRRYWKNKDQRLSRSRINRLTAVGFVWEAKKDPAFWAIQNQTTQEEDRWEAKLQMLLDYKKENGNCLVPKEYAPNMVLARWVGEQRKQMKAKSEGRYSILTDEREERLRDIGFVFNTRTREHLRNSVLGRFADKWNYMFQRFLEFKEKYGHGAVPRRWKEDADLASWAMRQRSHGKKYLNGKDSYLTKERFEMLKNEGFVFHMERNKYPMTGAKAYKESLSMAQNEAAGPEAAAPTSKERDKALEDYLGIDRAAMMELAPRPTDEEIAALSVEVDVIAAAIEAGEAEQLKQSFKQEDIPIENSKPHGFPAEYTPADKNESSKRSTRRTRSEPQTAKEAEQQLKLGLNQKGSPMEDSKPAAVPTEDTPVDTKERSKRSTRRTRSETQPSKEVEQQLKQMPNREYSPMEDSKPAAVPTEHTPADTKESQKRSTRRKSEPQPTYDARSSRTSQIQKAETSAAEQENDVQMSTSLVAHKKKIQEVGSKRAIRQISMTVSAEKVEVDSLRRTRHSKRIAGETLEPPVETKSETTYSDEETEDEAEDAKQQSDFEIAEVVDGDGSHKEMDTNPESELTKDNNEKEPKNKEADGDVEQNAAETQELPAEPKEEFIAEPTPEEIRKHAEEQLLKANKGLWTCENCGKDEYLNYLDSVAHEAVCSGLEALAIPVGVSLD